MFLSKGDQKRETPKVRKSQVIRRTVTSGGKSNELREEQKWLHINPIHYSKPSDSLMNRGHRHINKLDINIHSSLFHLLKASTQNTIHINTWHTTDNTTDLECHFPNLYQNVSIILTSSTSFQLLNILNKTTRVP